MEYIEVKETAGDSTIMMNIVYLVRYQMPKQLFIKYKKERTTKMMMIHNNIAKYTM
jgi:hypothetical protein